MQNRMKALQILTALILALLAFGPLPQQAVEAQTTGSTSLVIYEAYGGGGSTGTTAPLATFQNDYVVLFNMSSSSINLSDYELRYYSVGATTFSSKVTLSGSIAAGGYFLIKSGTTGTGDSAVENPDFTASINMSASSFAVEIYGVTEGKSVDLVGFGGAATKDTAAAPALSKLHSGQRIARCIDTDDNSQDFKLLLNPPAPYNTGTTLAPCTPSAPSVSSLAYSKDASDLALITTDFSLTFNVAVTFTAASITCGTDTITTTLSPVTATDPTAGDTQWTVNPDTDLPYGTNCSLNIAADAVHDLATPPLPMAAPYTYAFDTQPVPPVHASVASAVMAQDAYGVFPDTTIVLTFDQAVTPTLDWYSLVCDGSTVSSSVSADASSTQFTITPAAALPLGKACTLTIGAANLTPNLGQDYVLSIPVRPTTDAAPVFIGSVPAANATGVLPEATISLTYSEAVNFIPGNSATLLCGGTEVSFTTANKTDDPATLVFTPTAPLPAGNTCTLTVPPAAVSDADLMDPPDNPDAELTLSFSTLNTIMQVQGSGDATSLAGQTVTVRGVVTILLPAFRGYGLQDLNGDGNPATSDGIFVFTNSTSPLPNLNVGDLIQITGKVSEYFNQTQITATTFTKLSTEPVQLAATPVSLPMTAAQRESVEGMLVTFPQALTISEYYDYGRYGTVALTGSRHYTPTALFPPGPQAVAEMERQAMDTILLDDLINSQNPAPLRHPDGSVFSLDNRFRGGDTFAGITGFVHYSFDEYKIQPTTGAIYTALNNRPPAPEITPGELRVASMNVLNYFTTIDNSGNICGPSGNMECRGADTQEELTRQRNKILSALTGMQADIVGLVEIENDRPGQPANYAVQDLVDGINTALGGTDWKVVNTGAVGTDVIKVALIYNSAKVTAVGPYAAIKATDGFDVSVQRPTLAQTFRDHASNELLTIAVNHLKSKGSECAGDPDLLDGQGNCNLTRTKAAKALVKWLSNDPTGQGSDQFLIIGDLNAYPLEDPIMAIQAGPDGVEGTADDFINTVMRFSGQHAYSYGFDGAVSYLDHGLANRRLASYILDADYWHINADEPSVLDYDMSFKPAAIDALYEPNAYRSSDHDPVLISLLLNHPPMANDDFYQTYDNTQLSVNSLDGVLANDVELNKYDKVTASLVTPPANGTLVLNADGSFVYTPNANFAGQDTFTYSMDTDFFFRTQSGMTDTATVTIEVISTGEIPVAVADTYTVDSGQTLTVAAPGVLVNDTDADGDPLTAILVSSASKGTLTLRADGSFTYVPQAGFFGADSFTYKANDGETDSNTVTVTIHVLEKKAEPPKIFLPFVNR